jgi:hypothetical protein
MLRDEIGGCGRDVSTGLAVRAFFSCLFLFLSFFVKGVNDGHSSYLLAYRANINLGIFPVALGGIDKIGL